MNLEELLKSLSPNLATSTVCRILLLMYTALLAEAVISSNPGEAQNAAMDSRYPGKHDQQQTRSAAPSLAPNWEGSGVNPDDEDGDVEEGSGDVPPVEGSGSPPDEVPPILERPMESGGAVRRPGDVLINERVTDGITHYPNKTLSGSSIELTTTTTTTASTELFATTLRPPNLGKEKTETMKPKTQTTTTQRAKTTQPKEGEEEPKTVPDVKWRPPIMSTAPPPPINAFTPRTTRRPFFIADPSGTLEQLRPGIFAFMVGGVVIGLLLLILIISYLVYRLKKRDEGTYICEEPHQQAHYSYAYQKASIREFYA